MHAISVIFRKEVRDAVRSRWMVAFALTFGIVALVLSLVQASSDNIGAQGFNRTTAVLTNLSLLLVPLLALVVGAGAIAGERERGTWTTLLSQPITVGQLIVGKFAGLMVAIWATIALGFGGAGMIVALISPIADVGHYLLFSFLSAVLAAATLSIGMFISVFSGGKLRALSQALVVWFLLFVLYDLAAVGLAWTTRFVCSQRSQHGERGRSTLGNARRMDSDSLDGDHFHCPQPRCVSRSQTRPTGVDRPRHNRASARRLAPFPSHR